jgi:hypothetical protein
MVTSVSAKGDVPEFLTNGPEFPTTADVPRMLYTEIHYLIP